MCTLLCYDGWMMILDDWVRESPTQQFLWGVSALQQSKHVKHGPKKKEESEPTDEFR